VTRPSAHVTVGRLSLSADRTRVASAFGDGVVRIWNRESGRTNALTPGVEELAQVAYSGDGRRVVGFASDRVRVWDAAGGGSWEVPLSGDQEPLAVGINRDGSRLAIAILDEDTVVTGSDGRRLFALSKQVGEITTINFSPDDRHLVTAGEDDSLVRIWNARTGRLIRELPHNESVEDARYSDDGHNIVTGATDGTVRVWPVAGGAPVLLYGHVGPVDSVAFDASGERLVSAGADRTVRIWDAAGGESLATLLTYRESALGAGFSARATHVISSQDNGPMQATRCEVCGGFASVLKLARSRPARSLSESERQRLLADHD
jgi:WD40 repeat protein